MNSRLIGAAFQSESGRGIWELALILIAVIVIVIARPSPALGTTCGALLLSIAEVRRRSPGP